MRTTPTTVNAWISDNATAVRRRLSCFSVIDEDAFQDAYLVLVSEHNTPETGEALEQAFLKAYKRISNKSLGESFTTSHPDELFFTLLPSDETEPMEQEDEPKDRTPLAKLIRRHIRSVFPRRDAMAFEMRVNGYSFRDITDTLGIGTSAINSATRRIIAQTRRQFSAVAI